MHSETADDLEFLLPGVLHQFGNLLLTIQGNASTLDGDRLPRAQQAILGATRRAARTLRILHDLGGDTEADADSAEDLLVELVDLARLSVREAGRTIAMRSLAASGPTLVLAGPYTCRFLAALRLLLRHLPQGQRGTVFIALEVNDATRATVQLRFEPDAGALPFPVATAELLEALEQACPGSMPWTRCAAQGIGINLVFPTGAASQGAEA